MKVPETHLQPRPYNLEYLQTERFNLAVATSEFQIRGIFAHNRIQNPNVSFTRVRDTMVSYDCPSLPADELLALEALGVNPQQIVETTGYRSGKDDEVIKNLQVQGEAMAIKRYGEGITLSLKIDGRDPDFAHPVHAVAIRSKIAARYAASPAHQAMARANEQLQQMSSIPHSISTEAFDAKSDPLGTAAFLDQVGLTSGGNKLAREIRRGTPISEAVQSTLENSLTYGTQVHEDMAARTFTWGKGAVKQLSIDKETGGFTFSATMDPASNYFEIPNQAPGIEAIPFIETECARELCKLLDAAGLMFHPSLQKTMVGMSDSDRYGSVYTELSREVAKWVNSPNQTEISQLFVPYPSESEDEEVARERWKSADHSVEGEAASVLVDMIDNVLALDASHPQPTDLPVTGQRVQIRSGACFDVAAYYIGAAGEKYVHNGIRSVDEGTTKLLAKTHGSPTFMLTAPALFNGIPLPKGALLSKQADGYAFLRLTPFTFDNPADQLAVDPELAKARYNEASNIRTLGGVTMAHLVKAVV